MLFVYFALEQCFQILFRVMKHHAILFFFIPRNEYGKCARTYGKRSASKTCARAPNIFPECDHAIAKMLGARAHVLLADL